MSQDLSQPTNLPDFSGLDTSFDIIDSHHHIFGLDDVYYPWLTDEPETHFLLGNYDGIKKSKTKISDNVFIGSNSSLVAPVVIGDGATVGAGSVITTEVEDKALAVARGKQRNIANWPRPTKK